VKDAAQGIRFMVLRQIVVSVGALFVAISVHASSAQALSMKECSAKYKAAKETGTLSGMKWNDFRKAQCEAAATTEPTPSTAAPPSAARPAKTIAAPGRRATRYFPLPFRPNTLVSPQARRGCKLVWTNIGQTKAMVQTVV
jgi:hypothetical protein